MGYVKLKLNKEYKVKDFEYDASTFTVYIILENGDKIDCDDILGKNIKVIEGDTNE